jgi:hypothetical protein
MMTLAMTLDLAARPRRPPRGRPSVAGTPAVRLRHIECAEAVLKQGLPAKQVAAANGVSLRTVWYWTGKALRYDDPRATALRAIAGRN